MGKDLLKKAYRKWIHAADAILDMIVTCLPSPIVAQEYRMDKIFNTYDPEQHDEESKEVDPADYETLETSFKACDPSGPICVFVSKIIPFKQGTRAFGRVYSGTVKQGDTVIVKTSNSDAGVQQTVTGVGVCMGKDFTPVTSMPCGNTVVLGGIDKAIIKEATVVSPGLATNTFKHMKFAVSPVVQVAVSAKRPSDIEKLVKGLKKLEKVDQIVKITTSENDESIVAGAGDLHIEICLNQLREFSGIEIVASRPTVSYRETVSEP